jgi:hypothetical protein
VIVDLVNALKINFPTDFPFYHNAIKLYSGSKNDLDQKNNINMNKNEIKQKKISKRRK